MSSIEDLARQLRAFAAARDWEQFHSPKNLSMALAVEAAELLEHFQWLTQEQSRTLDDTALDAVRLEAADVFIYLVRLADVLGIDLLQAASDKLVLNARKYPPKSTAGV